MSIHKPCKECGTNHYPAHYLVCRNIIKGQRDRLLALIKEAVRFVDCGSESEDILAAKMRSAIAEVEKL